MHRKQLQTFSKEITLCKYREFFDMKKVVKKKKIIVPRGRIKDLILRTGAAKSTVYFALRYMVDSDKAREIRRMAIEDYGGVETLETVFL